MASVYYSSATAVYLCDYWILRKRLLKLPDLYTPGGIYWFYHGWNLRCVAAILLGMAPALPGFFMTCIDTTADNAAVKIFQLCWFVGAPLSMLIYLALNKIWPPEGLGIKELLTAESAVQVIDDVGRDSEDLPNDKIPETVTEKAVV
jgi:NCS1 family nucleobase:cation symporter-1